MIGYTKSQVRTKLSHLYSVSRLHNSDVSTMFNEVYSALESYYNRNEEFKEQGYKTFKKVVMDSLYRNLQCSRMDLLPPRNNNYPIGYKRIGDIFQMATFQEIMTVSDSAFNAAYSQTQTSSSDGSTTDSETHNSYLENWALKINSAVLNELGLLKNLENFCLYGYENVSMAFIFEELGNVWNSYTDDKRSFAKNIYIKSGWDWFEKTFNCGIFEPSYIDEIRK